MVRKNIIFWIKYTLLLLLYFVVVKFTATFINSELENTLILAEKGEFDLPLITDLFKKYFHPSYEIINSIYSILWLILIIEILYEIKRTDQNEFKIKLIYSFLLNFISFYFITIIFSFGIFSPRMIFISKFYSETIQIPEFSMYSLILKGINWCLLFIILIFIVKILKEKAFGK
jgi:hypothetical protein